MLKKSINSATIDFDSRKRSLTPPRLPLLRGGWVGSAPSATGGSARGGQIMDLFHHIRRPFPDKLCGGRFDKFFKCFPQRNRFEAEMLLDRLRVADIIGLKQPELVGGDRR